MKTLLNDNVLTVCLCGRIDTNNASQIEQELCAAVDGAHDADIVIDAESLDYISSAGLRVLMKLRQKATGNIQIVNVSGDVYEIFDITGFTELFDVQKAMREVSVEGCEVIGHGFYGTVYRIDEETIVKVYDSPDCLPMIRNEQRLAKLAFVKGIPTAISYDTVRVGDSYGSVFELLKAKSFNELLIADPDSFDTLVRQYVDFLRTVHGSQMDAGTLPMAKDRFISYLDSISCYITDEQLQRLKELINGLPDDLHLVHGDYQMKNIMVVDNEPMLIDMDTISTGQPIFDLQALYVTYVAFPEDDPDNLHSFFGIPNEWGERIWRKIIEYYYETTDENRISVINSKIKLLATIRFLFIISSSDLKNGQLGEKRIKRSQDSFAELLASVEDLII